jgi:hypothetical protein
MNRAKVIKAMREQAGWNVVSEGSNKVMLVREYGKAKPKTIAFTLASSDGKLLLEHPSYEFISMISHFRSVNRDYRLCLNKTYLISIIRTLKRAGIWQHVVNKDFLVVNRDCKKSNKIDVRKQLAGLLE